MGTRCRIGIKNENGSITSIYCHWDGYPSYVGKVLAKNYTDETKIRKLLELGDMSSLGTEPVANPKGWDYSEAMHEDMCVTYATRGEECPARKSINEEAYEKLTSECWGEYAYLFKNNKWYVSYSDIGFIEVETALKLRGE